MNIYHGSCECGQIEVEAKADLSKGTFKCNCRMCTKSRFWGVLLPVENFKLLKGEQALTRYSDNPVHHFCRTCGIKVYGRVDLPDGARMVAVSLAALDDLDPREWARLPVMVVDGRHDRFNQEADFKDHL